MFQGIVYYYRENQVLCRYQATLKEAVDPALLQQALDAARPLAEYYFCHVVWEKREARLEPNTAPCCVLTVCANKNLIFTEFKRCRQIDMLCQIREILVSKIRRQVAADNNRGINDQIQIFHSESQMIEIIFPDLNKLRGFFFA